jgi:hypothetical protein
MLRSLIILAQLAADAVRWCGLILRSPRSIEAENLFLHRRLALYKERGAIPLELQKLVRRMAEENPLWGKERIANELLCRRTHNITWRLISSPPSSTIDPT